ncbi:MAG: FtsH protease activity modulator HflK [Clostridiales bacterium]|jgi:membrane protease subunit HflK|nr:FtsH protease activity modulator HflK [Clostridiales bacterium]
MDYNRPPPKTINVNFNGRKIRGFVIAGIIVLFALILGFTSIYTVDNKETAVVTTFGRVTDTTGAGMHFKLPFGIQRVYLVEENVYQKIELGYRSDASGETFEVVDEEAKMITGDYNIVNVDFFVEYKISDPVKYLFASQQPELVLKNLVQSQVRNVIGSATVDSVLTTGKAEIQIRVKELIAAELEEYDIGLMLTDVKIQDAEPPTEEVIEAFKNVETAKQGAETAINEAKAYENAQLPQAQAEADKLLQNAEYIKQKRINEAVEQVALFEAMFSEYTLNPEITRTRMYYEAIRAAFPDTKIYINTTGGSGIEMILPLEDFVGGNTAPQITPTAPKADTAKEGE